jgi:hypothetical protein
MIGASVFVGVVCFVALCMVLYNQAWTLLCNVFDINEMQLPYACVALLNFQHDKLEYITKSWFFSMTNLNTLPSLDFLAWETWIHYEVLIFQHEKLEYITKSWFFSMTNSSLHYTRLQYQVHTNSCQVPMVDYNTKFRPSSHAILQYQVHMPHYIQRSTQKHWWLSSTQKHWCQVQKHRSQKFSSVLLLLHQAPPLLLLVQVLGLDVSIEVAWLLVSAPGLPDICCLAFLLVTGELGTL